MNKIIIDTDKKTVVCKKFAENRVLDECAQRALTETYALAIAAFAIGCTQIDDINPDVPFVGKAKCMDGDEFDLYTGQTIAENKANMKYHASMAKKYNQLERLFANAVKDMQKLKKVHEIKVTNIKNDLEKYGG